MKYLITLALMFSLTAHAESKYEFKQIDQDVNTPTPKALEGATITVTLKNGKQYKMDAKTFKVVPRKQQFKITDRIVVQTDSNPNPAPVQVVKEVQRDKNIVSLLLNRSLGEYTFSRLGPGSYRVENEYNLAVGLMYQRNVYKSLYLGVQADTHKSVGGNLGFSF